MLRRGQARHTPCKLLYKVTPPCLHGGQNYSTRTASQATHLDSVTASIGHPIQDPPAHNLDTIRSVGIENNSAVGHLQQQTVSHVPEAKLEIVCSISRQTGGLSRDCGLIEGSESPTETVKIRLEKLPQLISGRHITH